MSDTAKKARAAMKAKAHRLGSDRPLEKVDSSTWTPDPMINADVKTGLRPVSRRQFKKGGKVVGKVHGEEAMQRADRKPRKSGGEVKEWVNAKINRNVKDANEEREGKKHIGGMKKGGRAHHATTGFVDYDQQHGDRDVTARPVPQPMRRPADLPGRDVEPSDLYDADQLRRAERGYKKGGRTKKMDGGMMSPGMMSPGMAGAADILNRGKMTAGVPGAMMNFRGGGSRLQRAAGLKKGGKAEGHPDEAADKALIKKMVKPEARTGKAGGGKSAHEAYWGDMSAYKGKKWDESKEKWVTKTSSKRRPVSSKDEVGVMGPSDHDNPDKFRPGEMNKGGRAARKTGGGVFSGPGYPGKVPGAVPGGRTARATGGKTRGKGKTDINIVINAEKGGAGAGMMPPGGMPGGPPKGMPVPVPPAPGGMPPGMPMGMMPPGMMPPGGAPPMPPQGGMPMPRKSGGRTYRSYKDMDAGAGGAKGREEKTEIAKRKGGIQKA